MANIQNDRPSLFQYAVIFHPKATKDQIDRGERPKSEVITDLRTILAGSAKEVGVMAARSIDEKYVTSLEDVEILVRPF